MIGGGQFSRIFVVGRKCRFLPIETCITIETKDLRIKVRNKMRFHHRQNCLFPTNPQYLAVVIIGRLLVMCSDDFKRTLMFAFAALDKFIKRTG